MGIPTFFWLRNIGIGGRLFLAFVLISSITIVASGLATNTYLQLSDRLLLLKLQDIPGLDAAARLYYFSGLIEKVSNDASFNELDYTFLRLERLGYEITQYLNALPQVPQKLHQSLLNLIMMSSRQGELFQLKNEELDLQYQQSFLLENSQQHIQQLAAQINQYTNYTNTSIRGSLEGAIKSINSSIRNILLLSLISLSVACAISWFYVREPTKYSRLK